MSRQGLCSTVYFEQKNPDKHEFSILTGIFLGYQDSNLEMPESESGALPFGDSPIVVACGSFFSHKWYYTRLSRIMQEIFLKNDENHSNARRNGALR